MWHDVGLRYVKRTDQLRVAAYFTKVIDAIVEKNTLTQTQIVTSCRIVTNNNSNNALHRLLRNLDLIHQKTNNRCYSKLDYVRLVALYRITLDHTSLYSKIWTLKQVTLICAVKSAKRNSKTGKRWFICQTWSNNFAEVSTEIFCSENINFPVRNVTNC